MAAAASGDCHRPVGAFNPAWCLRPQTPTAGKGATAGSRWSEHDDRSAGTPSVSCSANMTTSRGRRARRHRRVFSSDASAVDPPSPRVGCMGQIREGRAAGGGSPPVRSTKFQRLRRIFSGRSAAALGVAAAETTPQAKTEEGTSCRGVAPGVVSISSGGSKNFIQWSHTIVSMAELDPPLPVVIRRPAAGGAEMSSLWKRRCGGAAPVPEGLQLRPQLQTHTRWLHQEASNTARLKELKLGFA